jgi:hypothetical protein
MVPLLATLTAVSQLCFEICESASYCYLKVSYLLIFLKQSCGQKRPLHALKESSSKLLHSKSLDLNVPAGENDAGNKDGCSCCVAQAQDVPVGTYYTTGINW